MRVPFVSVFILTTARHYTWRLPLLFKYTGCNGSIWMLIAMLAIHVTSTEWAIHMKFQHTTAASSIFSSIVKKFKLHVVIWVTASKNSILNKWSYLTKNLEQCKPHVWDRKLAALVPFLYMHRNTFTFQSRWMYFILIQNFLLQNCLFSSEVITRNVNNTKMLNWCLWNMSMKISGRPHPSCR